MKTVIPALIVKSLVINARRASQHYTARHELRGRNGRCFA
jgi:hypothetical protein